MGRKSIECEVEGLLNLIGGRWKVLILRELFGGTKRHAELRRALPGITQKVLTEQLREMEQGGIIQKKDYHSAHPRVEYSLSASGQSLKPIIDAMHGWVVENSGNMNPISAAGRFAKSA